MEARHGRDSSPGVSAYGLSSSGTPAGSLLEGGARGGAEDAAGVCRRDRGGSVLFGASVTDGTGAADRGAFPDADGSGCGIAGGGTGGSTAGPTGGAETDTAVPGN
jgi:hypothetical protein